MSKRGSQSALFIGNNVKQYEGNLFAIELKIRQDICRQKELFWSKYTRLLKNVANYERSTSVRRNSMYRDDIIQLSTNLLAIFGRLHVMMVEQGYTKSSEVAVLQSLVTRVREIRSTYVEEATAAKMEIFTAPEELTCFGEQLKRALRK